MHAHHCPEYCHYCPDMEGDVMPMCMGSVHCNDLDCCYCSVEHECARNAAHQLAENPRVPKELKEALHAFAESPVPGRRVRKPLYFSGKTKIKPLTKE